MGEYIPKKPYRGQYYTSEENEAIQRRLERDAENLTSGLSDCFVISTLMEELDPEWKHKLVFK